MSDDLPWDEPVVRADAYWQVCDEHEAALAALSRARTDAAAVIVKHVAERDAALAALDRVRALCDNSVEPHRIDVDDIIATLDGPATRVLASDADGSQLVGPVCTDPDCTIRRRPGRPMHGPHALRAALDGPDVIEPPMFTGDAIVTNVRRSPSEPLGSIVDEFRHGYRCENHPKLSWPDECDCGAGMPAPRPS